MAKAYWIARVDIHNEEGYKPYMAANPAIFQKFGGRFIVRGGRFENPEGGSRTRNVVIEFPDYATALACYHSPDYQSARDAQRTLSGGPSTGSSERSTTSSGSCSAIPSSRPAATGTP